MTTATFEIRYPSGKRFSATGGLSVITDPSFPFCVSIRTDETILILDPRAIVLHHEDRTVAYCPRDWLDADMFPRDMAEWLADNPEWPEIPAGYETPGLQPGEN